MRTHGKLTRWNDDRGFGFITPAKGQSEIFVHVSAFPHEGGRPRLNELISFEVEPGKDGKPRAVRVMRPAQKAATRPPQRRERVASGMRAGEWVVALLLLAGIGLFAWSKLHRANAPPRAPEQLRAGRFAAPESEARVEPATATFSCDGRTMCSQMTSCQEATYFLNHCPGTQMDGDNDRVPCEQQWCN